MSGLGPNNPADLGLKAIAFDAMSQVSGKLLMAIICMRFGDYAEALEYLDLADATLDGARRKSQEWASSWLARRNQRAETQIESVG